LFCPARLRLVRFYNRLALLACAVAVLFIADLFELRARLRRERVPRVILEKLRKFGLRLLAVPDVVAVDLSFGNQGG
jgi:hypothetical protein